MARFLDAFGSRASQDEEAEVARRSPTQQQKVARCHELGRARLRAAQSIFAAEAAPRLTLLRDAATCFVVAAVAAHDELTTVEDVDAAAAWARLDSCVARGVLPALPPAVSDARKWLGSSCPLDVPRATGESDEALASAFTAVRWLEDLVEPRPIDALRFDRRVHMAAIGLALAVAGGTVLATVLAPRNLARGKPVRPTSKVDGTSGSPGGLTNGLVEYSFGTETDVEDSPSFMIDLGASQVIGKVVVYNRGAGNPDDSLPLALDVGETPDSLDTLATCTKSFSRTHPWIVGGIDHAARYVRVRKTTRGALALAEIEVYR